MSTLNATKRSSERDSDDFIEQPEPEPNHTLTKEKSDIQVPVDPAFARKTLRKVDLYVLPILAVLYSFSLIDRVNISWASVYLSLFLCSSCYSQQCVYSRNGPGPRPVHQRALLHCDTHFLCSVSDLDVLPGPLPLMPSPTGISFSSCHRTLYSDMWGRRAG